MEKLVAKNPQDFSIYSEDAFGKIYKFPKRFITIRSKQQKRDLTEEQRELRREQMSKMRLKKTDSADGNAE